MSLAEIKDFVDMTKQGDATLESRLAVFRNQRDVVKRQIAELRRRYIKLDVAITSGASCTSSMKINIPYGVAFSALYVQNAAFQNGVLVQNTAFQSRVWCKMSCKW